MKKLLFIFLPLLLLYGCSNEMLFDTDEVGTSTTRGTTSDQIYYFGSSDSAEVEDFVFLPKGTTSPPGRTLSSYVDFNGVRTMLQPEIVSKPSWVNYIICSQYYDMYVLMVAVEDNTSSQRSGNIVLRQPESNKTLSVGIIQNGINNYITIEVNRTYKNHYEFIATTTYPVKGKTYVRLPLVVYNDGGEMNHVAVIEIAKGENTGSYEMDWNSSPLVGYHGDIKGYRLSEGEIEGEDNVYTYSFIRYW